MHHRPVVVALTIAAMLASVELGVRTLIPRISAVESRIAQEYATAARLTPQEDGHSNVLLLGNSLLLHAVDIPTLNQALRPKVKVHRLVIEDTSYWDWYFGLEKLLDEGAAPSQVLYMLSPKQLTANYIRGPYSAYHLYRPGQIVQLSHQLKFPINQEVELVFSSMSAAYGLRQEYRNVIFSKVMPGADAIGQMYAGSAQKSRATLPSGQAFDDIVKARIAQVNALCARHHVPHCTLILAPTATEDPDGQRVADLSSAVMPQSPALYLPHRYDKVAFQPDGFHMSEAGRHTFTGLLAQSLPGHLNIAAPAQ